MFETVQQAHDVPFGSYFEVLKMLSIFSVLFIVMVSIHLVEVHIGMFQVFRLKKFIGLSVFRTWWLKLFLRLLLFFSGIPFSSMNIRSYYLTL